MRLNILSDLHLQKKCIISKTKSDVAILAGDISENPLLSMPIGYNAVPNSKNIVQIAGNHDYIGYDYNTALNILFSNQKGDHYFLENSTCIIQEDITVRFIGCTLWTNFSLFDKSDVFIKKYADSVHDFYRIKNFMPEEWLRRHIQSKEFILDTVSSAFDGTNIIIHHHLTDFRSVHPQYQKSPLTPAYAMSDMQAIFTHPKCSLIVHGHTHNNVTWRYNENSPLVVCNPMGGTYYECDYPTAMNSDFNPDFCVDIDKKFKATICSVKDKEDVL